jgi:hypothetical protein
VRCSWITPHPDVASGALGEFETCPDWVLVMDMGQRSARIHFPHFDLNQFRKSSCCKVVHWALDFDPLSVLLILSHPSLGQ